MADNASRKFKFISPGVFINEIDNSELPDTPSAIGPVVVGLAAKGPTMTPVIVNSFSDFIDTFGNPVAGNQGTDIWRDRSGVAPTYGAYAAQAYLRNNSPLTFVRLRGDQDANAATAGKAGWLGGTINSTAADGGAWGLVVFPSSSLTPVTHASTTLTFAGATTNDQVVTLISADGTSRTYTAKASETLANNEFASGGGNINRINSLASCITSSFGHAGLLSAPSSSDGAITVTQLASGSDGNTVIVEDLDNFTSANQYFTGGSGPATYPVVTGALATTFYCTGGRVVISGTRVDGANTASACELYASDSNGNLTLGISSDGTLANLRKVTIDLNASSQNFVRETLNTNPTVTNSTITTAATRTNLQGGAYWLGETFDLELRQASSTGGIGVLGNNADNASVKGATFHAAILPLRNTENTDEVLADRRFAATKATTGWFISQDLSANSGVYSPLSMQKLFRIEALQAGEDIQTSIKISISNIKAPEGDFQDYGSFSLLVRAMSDNDNVPVILERFDSLNLNPASANYIGAQIGDRYEAFDTITKTNRVYGTHTSMSRYIRVVMDEDVDKSATTPAFLPFGVFGPLKYRDVSLVSGSGGFSSLGTYASASRGSVATMLDGNDIATLGDIGGNSFGDNNILAGFIPSGSGGDAAVPGQGFSGSIKFPSVPLRGTTAWGAPKTLKSTYWGAWVGKTNSDVKFNLGVIDALRSRASGLESNPSATTRDVTGQTDLAASDPVQIAWVFSLDDVSGSADSSPAYTYTSGSRAAGTSVSAASGSYTGSLVAGLDRFTTVMFGGTEGFDITERNPFRNALMDDTTETTSYELFSLKKAINILADAEQIQYNLITMPGVTQPLVTNHLLDTVEERGDALAIIDLDKVYTADTENTESSASRNAFTIKQAVDALKARNINNSYGAAYYPWVKIQDTVTNRVLWVPPSVAALGALSSNDRTAAPWFAPAGFARGGLTEGAAGIPVLDVSKRLTSDNRDDLYAANINPIAKFPAEGIVIFGQKTLQQTASALDRINVRRLLIFLKREISFIASRMLFQQNTRDTWNVFQGQARPLLESVKAEFGIDDFKLILDESTTTPDLIDRNIIYAKLIVKPTRSVEFFAIDFVVTNSGASFED